MNEFLSISKVVFIISAFTFISLGVISG